MKMQLAKLQLTNFRNHAAVQLDFSSKLNAIVGANGMGKTNLLDAIHYIALTRSFQTTYDAEVLKNDESFFRIQAAFEHADGSQHEYVVKYQTGKRKSILKNDAPYKKFSEHIGNIPLVITKPSDIELIDGNTTSRRQFMDATLSQVDPVFLQNLIGYNKLLTQRNKLLKSHPENNQLIDSYTAQMAPLAQTIFTARKALLEDMANDFQQFYESVSGNAETVSLKYISALENASLEALFTESLAKDKILGRTTAGIHRDDLETIMKGMPVKRMASQGQIKSFALAMKFAQYSYLQRQKQMNPLLLIDDISDRLDNDRLMNLITVLTEKIEGQVFITDTRQQRMHDMLETAGQSGALFVVNKNDITPVKNG